MRIGAAVIMFLIAPAAAAAGLLPWWYSTLSVAASLASLLLYAADKRAARAGTRRIAERTLHLTALLGGWPGALAAQQLFRHKYRKTPFMLRFVLSAVLHSSVSVALSSRYTAG
jgi:uncharacterized membrane protein YsdA (DUF1294 family)